MPQPSLFCSFVSFSFSTESSSCNRSRLDPDNLATVASTFATAVWKAPIEHPDLERAVKEFEDVANPKETEVGQSLDPPTIVLGLSHPHNWHKYQRGALMCRVPVGSVPLKFDLKPEDSAELCEREEWKLIEGEEYKMWRTKIMPYKITTKNKKTSVTCNRSCGLAFGFRSTAVKLNWLVSMMSAGYSSLSDNIPPRYLCSGERVYTHTEVWSVCVWGSLSSPYSRFCSPTFCLYPLTHEAGDSL